MRFVSVFFVVILTIGDWIVPQSIEPQTQSLEAQVRYLLSLPEARNHAWAAYLIRRFRLEGFVPDAISLLRDPGEGSASDKTLAIRSCLDALIQVDASVPEEAIAPLFDVYPSEAVILLSKSPAEHQQLFLRLLRTSLARSVWTALCNMLASTKTPGFAVLLLRDLKISIMIEVFDVDAPGTGVDGGYYRADAFAVPAGFPPTAFYELGGRERGSVLLNQGRRSIHYTRHLVQPGQNIQLFREDQKVWLEDSYSRIEVLRQLLTYGDILEGSYYERVRWKDATSYESAVISLLDKINHSYDVYLEGLPLYGFLTGEEAAGLRPNILLEVTDQRTNRSTHLPKISGKNVTAMWPPKVK